MYIVVNPGYNIKTTTTKYEIWSIKELNKARKPNILLTERTERLQKAATYFPSKKQVDIRKFRIKISLLKISKPTKTKKKNDIKNIQLRIFTTITNSLYKNLLKRLLDNRISYRKSNPKPLERRCKLKLYKTKNKKLSTNTIFRPQPTKKSLTKLDNVQIQEGNS